MFRDGTCLAGGLGAGKCLTTEVLFDLKVAYEASDREEEEEGVKPLVE